VCVGGVNSTDPPVCVCVCVRACACERVSVCVCVSLCVDGAPVARATSGAVRGDA
jgi:hypothetical protein